MPTMLIQRQSFLRRLFAIASWGLVPAEQIQAFSMATPDLAQQASILESSTSEKIISQSVVAFKELSLPIGEFGVEVPVGCWFPSHDKDLLSSQSTKKPSYNYRISVRRIGQMLAGWDFIPAFYARDYSLGPTRGGVADGFDVSLPTSGPVIILAHGFLGSRFDLSHLAEALADEGFVCLAPEYPESLAATYDRIDGLDRAVINDKLLQFLQNNLNVQGTKYGIVGHSLGCKTVLRTGDNNWARVLIAGVPRLPDGTAITGNALFISSMNDGAMSPARFGGAQGFPQDIVVLQEDALLASSNGRLPSRAAILFDRPDAPNHISFLSESVNDSMIDFLSALLPVAKAFDIPLLDFDRYQVSRDSMQTAELVHPLIIQYLKQELQKD